MKHVQLPTMEQRLAARRVPLGRAVMRQRWAGLLFLHWEVDADWIVGQLPDGLHVDTHDGKAWIGVVPFFMDRVRPVVLPPVPWLSWFLELNVRTYVHDSEGNPGVWFFSLDCNQPVAVEIARRLFHLPYQHAAMRAETQGSRIRYHSRRKTKAAEEAVFDYEIASVCSPAVEGSLEWFLVERYILFSSDPQGRLFHGRVHHDPYRIAVADCDAWSTEPLRNNGFPVPEEGPSSMLVAAPVDVMIYPLMPC